MLVFTHPACADHDPSPGHPEQPARLAAAMAAFKHPALVTCPVEMAPLASREQLCLAHDPDHVERVWHAGESGRRVQLDPDTAVASGSLTAARHAAGAVIAGVDAVLGGRTRQVFCAVRPPGHHASAAQAMGFCQFNSIAIGARHAIHSHGLKRVAIVDFDVHHGNGSQAIFWRDPAVLVVSSHQWPLYPGSGRADETGSHDNIVNLTLPAGTGSAAFRQAWQQQALPRIDAFAPELILVSAGFDGHADDPLASFELSEDDYHWLTGELNALAARHAGGRLVSALEGGYHLAALSACVQAHALALRGLPLSPMQLQAGDPGRG
ncbi:MAG: histone deacetylase family protein [Xanthomonadales bacterium]|nr:histone deacetylase family protein [Xanthomonadales bacterium]